MRSFHAPLRTTARPLLSALLVAHVLAPAASAQTPAAEVKDAANATLLRVNTDGGLIGLGTLNVGTIPASGEGTRLMWFPASAAFRAGYVSGTEWDEASVGFGSFAAGYNTKASGVYATALGIGTTASGFASTAMGSGTTAGGSYTTAMGNGTTASGDGGTAMGQQTTASGISATAMGQGTTASGTFATATGWLTTASGSYATAMGSGTTASRERATAMGSGTRASGVASTAMGLGTTAQAYGSLAIGQYNVPFGSPTAFGFDHPLLIVGNGTSDEERSNTLILLKNGDLNTFGRLSILLNSSLSNVHLRLFESENDYARLRFENTASGNYWDVAGLSGATLNFYTPARGDVMSLRSTGNPLVMVNGAFLSAGGAWTNASDRALKTGFETADADDVLARLVSLPVTRWTYTAEPSAAHIGPMAQDFRAAFGLGSDERSIATVDADGVLMLSVQALDGRARRAEARVAGLEAEADALHSALAVQAERLARVEALLARLAGSSAPAPQRAGGPGR